MSIWITGDTHGENDISKINTTNWSDQKNLTKKDYLIIAGDFGLLWKNIPDSTESYLKEWYNDKKFTTLFLDGNHENFPRINALPEVKKFGGTVGKVSDSIYHLKRGQIYTINNKKFFIMGGGLSVDKQNRTEGISWWPEEIPSYKEQHLALDNLDKHDNKVDYIITHTAPQSIVKEFNSTFCSRAERLWFEKEMRDITSDFLQIIIEKVAFKEYYCGHFHIDWNYKNFHLLYQKVEKI